MYPFDVLFPSLQQQQLCLIFFFFSFPEIPTATPFPFPFSVRTNPTNEQTKGNLIFAKQWKRFLHVQIFIQSLPKDMAAKSQSYKTNFVLNNLHKLIDGQLLYLD